MWWWPWGLRQQKLQDDYREALRLGEVLVAYARVMMIGPGGVGKSSLLRGLMNKKLPRNAESTVLADTKMLKPHFWAKSGQTADSYWEEVTDQDEIQELAGLVHLVALTKSGAANPSRAAKILSTMTAAVAVSVFRPLQFIAHNREVSTIHDEYMSNVKDSVVRDILTQALESPNSSLESPASTHLEVLMHVWDCGGLPVFLDVLPTFLTSRTMFLLLFDASKNLLDKSEKLCHKEGKVSRAEEDFSVLQLLTQWMACIHATLTSQNAVGSSNADSQSSSSCPAAHTEENSARQSTEGSTIQNFPRIIPVGTHGDDATKKDEILATLRSHCGDKAFTHLLLNGVIVDNTTAGKQAEDPGFSYIRRKVHHFATDDLAIPTPVAWVLFRKVLQKVAECKSCSIVSYQQAVAVGEACGIAESVLPSVLHFYHELAVFLHYAQIESLSQFIITDPQWLIKQFGMLLAPEELQQEVSIQAVWKHLLRENGILVQPLYEEVWKESNCSPQSLADLLEHFGLAALINPQIKVTPFPSRKYFVPSVLQSSSQTADSTTKPVKKSSPLHLTFSTQYVPPGFFTRLATTLSKESECLLLFERGVFRNKMTFAYGNAVDRIDEFTIFKHSSSVQITVVRNEYRLPHIPTFATVCHSIMELIKKCSASVCQWLPSVKVEAALCCEQCPDKDHFILILPGTTTCSVPLCQAGINCRFTNDQQNWLTIPNTPKSLAQSSDLSDAELLGVADAIQRDGKLKELADTLEVVPLLKSVEGAANAPLILIQRWRAGVDMHGLEAHSLLVHHLRCIGLTITALRLHFREYRLLSDPSTRTRPSAYPSEEKKEPLSLSHIIAYSRCIDADSDLTLLAAALDIDDEEVATIKSKYKLANGQALQMLKKWQSSGTHTKQELADILQAAGFVQAVQNLYPPANTSEAEHVPRLQDLVTYVRTTEWYRLGLLLDLDDYNLQKIRIDARDCQQHLTMVFETWLNVFRNPSWGDVVKAVKGIGENRLGAKLEQKFCK